MAPCQTNCIEKPISKGFEKLGRFVGNNPTLFIILPLILSVVLGGGFYSLKELEAYDIEEQFTPINGPAKEERQFVQQNFPQNDSEFSHLRLYTEGTFSSIIFVSKSSNILTERTFEEIIRLDEDVKKIEAGGYSFKSLCAMINGSCVSNAILDIVNYNSSEIISAKIPYPFYRRSIFLGSTVGGVTLKSRTNELEKARAIKLFYFLRDENRTRGDQWLNVFLMKASAMQESLKTVSMSYFTSLSRQEEFKSNSKTVIPLFSVTYFLTISFSIISCLRFDCVRTKVWVATFGVISAGLAVLSSFGLLLYCGVPFDMTVASAPFLILGIGVDDMFIVISCWQRTKVKDDVEERLAATYKEAAVSITITTLTDVLAFYIGLLTPFRSVQSFCLYTGTALLFCYIYNITFFGAVMALNGRREQSNRHWITCMKVPMTAVKEETSSRNKICCVGGDYDLPSGKEKVMPVNGFLEKYYGPFLINPWSKVFIVLLYFGYLASSIYGCFQMQEGIDLKNLAADGSYVGPYYDLEHKFFSEYGPNVMVVVKEEFQYWNETSRCILESCFQKFERLPMVANNMTISWLESYLQFGREVSFNLNNKTVFMRSLPTYLKISGFTSDLNYTKDQIYASRMFIQTINISTAVDEKNTLLRLRETAAACDVPLLLYHPAFIYYDQYAVIVSNTIQNILFATMAMLVISLLLIPNPICSLWVTFAIASVIVGVAGFMALWDVNLDSVSMINLIICIGFSVDFSAHISYSFISSDKPTANEKAIDAITQLGYPIIQGAISTILGVVVLSAAQSYIFRTFFKIMLLVILFGALHGIAFIPVFLTFFGTCRNSEIKSEENLEDGSSANQALTTNTVETSLSGD